MSRTLHSFTSCKDQKGGALVLALLVLLVMSIVVMGMAADSDLDLKISRNLELKNQAFNNAETGIALTTAVLRHVIVYRHWIQDDGPVTLSFEHYVLEIPEGLISLYDDEHDSNLTLKHNGNAVAHINVSSNKYPGEEDKRWFKLKSQGFNDNSNNIIYTVVEELDVGINAPLSFFNDKPQLELKGNSLISGRNHPVPENFLCKGNDCNREEQPEYAYKLPIYSKPSIMDEEDIVHKGGLEDFHYETYKQLSSNPNKHDRNYWMQQAIKFEAIAIENENVYESDYPSIMGTRTDPEISVVKGGQTINNVNGAGILIIKDGSRISGNFHFEGLVIYILSQDADSGLFSSGNNTVYGGMMVLGEASEIELEDEDSDTVELAGNPSIMYSTQALASAMSAFKGNGPLRRLSWKSE